MAEQAWVAEFPGSVTVCDARGLVVEMNERAAATCKNDGWLSPEIPAETPHVVRRW